MSNATLRPPVSVSPSVPTSFVTDNGTAVPAANVLEIVSTANATNNVNGITIEGGLVETGAANRVQAQLTNRFRQSTTTSGAVTSTVTILSALAAGEYILDLKISMRPTVGAVLIGGGYTIVGAVDSDGITATLISGQQIDDFEPAHLVGSSALIGVSGNTITVTFTGVAAYDLNWVVAGEYMLGI